MYEQKHGVTPSIITIDDNNVVTSLKGETTTNMMIKEIPFVPFFTPTTATSTNLATATNIEAITINGMEVEFSKK